MVLKTEEAARVLDVGTVQQWLSLLYGMRWKWIARSMMLYLEDGVQIVLTSNINILVVIDEIHRPSVTESYRR